MADARRADQDDGDEVAEQAIKRDCDTRVTDDSGMAAARAVHLLDDYVLKASSTGRGPLVAGA